MNAEKYGVLNLIEEAGVPALPSNRYFITGKITREAWAASCQMVLMAAGPSSVTKCVMGPPVLAMVTRTRGPWLKMMLPQPKS